MLATGGGVVLRPANREQLKTNGTVVYIHAEPPMLWERTRRSRHRPLLNNTTDQLGRLVELYGIRDVLYREVADIVVESERDALVRFAQGLDTAAARGEPVMITVDVALGERSYPIAIGSGLLDARRRAPRRAASVAPRGHRLEPGGGAALARAACARASAAPASRRRCC